MERKCTIWCTRHERLSKFPEFLVFSSRRTEFAAGLDAMRRTKGSMSALDSRGSSALKGDTDPVARFNSLERRVHQLEEEQVDYEVRHAEEKLKGLLQTLHSYEGCLHELHRLTNERKVFAQKAAVSFDLLGKKHKEKRIQAFNQKVAQASLDEEAQLNKLSELGQKVSEQYKTVHAWKRKARELDYVRQCAADLVEAIPVHKDADDQHNALEQAVCGLTPRIKAIQEDRANYATMKSRYKTAAHQQREAAELLEEAFIKPHQLLQNTFGGHTKHHEHLDEPDRKRRALAVITADRLLKSSVLNMRCRQFSSSCKGTVLPDDRLESLQSTLLPLSGKKLDLNTLEAEQIAERTIKLLLQTEPQIRNIAKVLGKQAKEKQAEMEHITASMRTYKERLDTRRHIMLQKGLPISELARSASAPLFRGECSLYTEQEFERYTQNHRLSSSSLSSLGDRTSSYGSDLARLGSVA